jgi:hypothetical protein
MVAVSDGEYEVNAEEVRATLDEQARRRFGLSWAELHARYEHGEVDSGQIGDLLILADLLLEREPA